MYNFNSKDGDHVPKSSELDLFLLKIKSNPELLSAVKNQTDDLCLAAVKQNASALEFVINQTDEICLAALKSDYTSLKFVKNQTDDFLINAITLYPSLFSHISNPTLKVIVGYILGDTQGAKLITNADELLLNSKYFDKTVIACEKIPALLKYLPNHTDLHMRIVSRHPPAIQFIDEPSEFVKKKAVLLNPFTLRFIKVQTEELCLYAVNGNAMAIEYVENITKKIALDAIKKNKHSFSFIPDELTNDQSFMDEAVMASNSIFTELNGANPRVLLSSIFMSQYISMSFMAWEHYSKHKNDYDASISIPRIAFLFGFLHDQSNHGYHYRKDLIAKNFSVLRSFLDDDFVSNILNFFDGEKKSTDYINSLSNQDLFIELSKFIDEDDVLKLHEYIGDYIEVAGLDKLVAQKEKIILEKSINIKQNHLNNLDAPRKIKIL